MRSVTSAMLLVAILGSPAFGAGPTCAILDADKDPRVALLEAKLLTDDSATWVERANIDKVLKEQKLQALFSPQGVGERVRLGKLLKADLLVMVRPVKGAESPTLEVVVSETASGLRLMLRAVPVTKSTDDDVAALLAAVREGIKRHGEKITEIVAVPPFVSNDLEFTHDYLKGALAKLAEGEALGRKGVVLVELAEAEALAKEIALTDPGARVNRPLPVYLMGEYRNEGRGKDRTIGLKLRAERGGKLLGKAAEWKAKAGEESDRVRKWATGTLDELAKDDKSRPLADAKAEAKVLADRAKVFSRLAQWEESLALFEASLLLDPDQITLNVEAVNVLSPLIRAAWAKSGAMPAEVERFATLYRRGLVHVDAFFARGGDPSDYRSTTGSNFVGWFRHSGNSLVPAGVPTKAGAEIYEALRKDEREVILRIIPIVAKRGKPSERYYVSWAAYHLPEREKYELLERLIADFRELPNTTERIVAYGTFGWAQPPDTPEFHEFLKRLESSNDKARQQAAAQLRVLLKPKPEIVEATFGPGPGRIRFTPITFTIEGAVPAAARPKGYAGILAIDEKIDVVWQSDALYVMKEKGKLRLLWDAPGGQGQFSTVTFDGKYVWATLPRGKQNPILVLVDPQAEKSWDLSKSEGIPIAPEDGFRDALTQPTAFVASLEPGRACLVGSFAGRAWIGIASFEAATGKARVKVIHEAKEALDRTDADEWKKSTVAFTPCLAVALIGKAKPGEKPERRVLVGREPPGFSMAHEAPLVVDPDRGTVEVLNDRGWGGIKQDECTVVEGAVYIRPRGLGLSSFARFAVPELKREVLATNLPLTGGLHFHLAAQGSRFHIIVQQASKRVPATKPGDPRSVPLYQWSTVGIDGKNPRVVANELASLHGVWVSSHYGLVTLIDEPGSRRPLLNTVEILEPAPKKK